MSSFCKNIVQIIINIIILSIFYRVRCNCFLRLSFIPALVGLYRWAFNDMFQVISSGYHMILNSQKHLSRSPLVFWRDTDNLGWPHRDAAHADRSRYVSSIDQLCVTSYFLNRTLHSGVNKFVLVSVHTINLDVYCLRISIFLHKMSR